MPLLGDDKNENKVIFDFLRQMMIILAFPINFTPKRRIYKITDHFFASTTVKPNQNGADSTPYQHTRSEKICTCSDFI